MDADIRELYEIISLSFSRCDNEGWDAPYADEPRDDGKSVMTWQGKTFIMTLERA